MQQIYFKKEGLQNYMVLDCEQELETGYQVSLLQHHAIPYFLQYELREIDGKQSLYYRLTYRTTLESVADSISFTYLRIRNMVESIIGAMETLEEYLLEADGVMWKSNRIFVEVASGKLMFCYCPIQELGKGSLREFLLELLQRMDKQEEKAKMYFLQFFHLVTESDCTLDQLKAFLKNSEQVKEHNPYLNRVEMTPYSTKEQNLMMKESIMEVPKEKVQEALFSLEEEPVSIEAELTKQKKSDGAGIWVIRVALGIIGLVNIAFIVGLLLDMLTYDYAKYLFVSLAVFIVLTIIYMNMTKEETADEMMKSYFAEEGKDTMSMFADLEEDMPKQDTFSFKQPENRENDYGETVVLSGEEEKQEEIIQEDYGTTLYLKAMNGEYPEVYVKKPSIVLGCMNDCCDYILAVKGISRMHAKLIQKEEGMYVLDLNSTNGTYLNGELIESGKEYRIEEGDMLAFAQCKFLVMGKVI